MCYKNIKEHNWNWLQTPDHSHRILIIGDSWSISKLYFDEIDLYTNYPYGEKYQFLINKYEGAGLKLYIDSKAFIEYSNHVNDVYENIKKWNPSKECKTSFLMIWLLICIIIKKLNRIVTELFIRQRKLNTSLAFIMQSYFAVPNTIRLNLTHYFIVKNPSKQELQKIAINNSSDINSKYLKKYQ